MTGCEQKQYTFKPLKTWKAKEPLEFKLAVHNPVYSIVRLYLLVGSLNKISIYFTDQFEIVTFNSASSPTKLLKTDRVVPNLCHVFDTISFKDHVIHVIGSD